MRMSNEDRLILAAIRFVESKRPATMEELEEAAAAVSRTMRCDRCRMFRRANGEAVCGRTGSRIADTQLFSPWTCTAYDPS